MEYTKPGYLVRITVNGSKNGCIGAEYVRIVNESDTGWWLDIRDGKDKYAYVSKKDKFPWFPTLEGACRSYNDKLKHEINDLCVKAEAARRVKKQLMRFCKNNIPTDA